LQCIGYLFTFESYHVRFIIDVLYHILYFEVNFMKCTKNTVPFFLDTVSKPVLVPTQPTMQ